LIPLKFPALRTPFFIVYVARDAELHRVAPSDRRIRALRCGASRRRTMETADASRTIHRNPSSRQPVARRTTPADNSTIIATIPLNPKVRYDVPGYGR
jgi:hypothetical protein